jgi:hypothetical protein
MGRSETKKLCRRQCNNGWMSDLENAVRPTMVCLINDIAMELDAEQQRLLALWAVKTAMVIEGVKQAKNGSPRMSPPMRHTTKTLCSKSISFRTNSLA